MPLREGDVVRYRPEHSHCREGMATYERIGSSRALVLLDSYWTSDRTVVSPDEYEVLFNLGDVESVSGWEWETHKPADRFLLTHQHGHQRQHFVRCGSSADHDTIVANAREALAEAEDGLRSANLRVEDRRRDLDRVLAGGGV